MIWTWILPLSAVYIPREPPIEKTKFYVESGCHLEIIFWLWTGSHTHFPSHNSNLCRPCACCYKFQYICTSVMMCLEDAVSFVSSRTWLLQSFHLSDSWREWCSEDIPSRVECSKASHSLNIVHLWLSVLVTIYCKRILIDDGWTKYWPMTIAEIIWIIALLCSYGRTTMLGLPLGPWPI